MVSNITSGSVSLIELRFTCLQITVIGAKEKFELADPGSFNAWVTKNLEEFYERLRDMLIYNA